MADTKGRHSLGVVGAEGRSHTEWQMSFILSRYAAFVSSTQHDPSHVYRAGRATQNLSSEIKPWLLPTLASSS